jgi:spore maturation protein B
MVELFRNIINIISAVAIPFLIVLFLGWGFFKKVKVYEVFIEGAKDGFSVSVKIIPYLVAMLVAIGIFRASGAMDVVTWALSYITKPIGMPAEVLPLAILRPLSGSGSMGLMAELMKVHGPDSFIGVLASTMYGSSETTFYILAVYFGAVGIKNTRHALPAGLIADLFGMLGALFICRIFFGNREKKYFATEHTESTEKK